MSQDHDLRGRLEELEAQQALLVQALAVVCRDLGYQVGMQQPWGQADWPHIVIDLPVLGPVAWRIPHSTLRLRLPNHSTRWDHSRDPERYQRLSSFLAAKEFAASGQPPSSPQHKKGHKHRGDHSHG